MRILKNDTGLKLQAIRSDSRLRAECETHLARSVHFQYSARVKRGWECGLLGEAARVCYRDMKRNVLGCSLQLWVVCRRGIGAAELNDSCEAAIVVEV